MWNLYDPNHQWLMTVHSFEQGDPGLMGELGPAGLPGLRVSLLPGFIDADSDMLLSKVSKLTFIELFTARVDIYWSILTDTIGFLFMFKLVSMFPDFSVVCLLFKGATGPPGPTGPDGPQGQKVTLFLFINNLHSNTDYVVVISFNSFIIK